MRSLMTRCNSYALLSCAIDSLLIIESRSAQILTVGALNHSLLELIAASIACDLATKSLALAVTRSINAPVCLSLQSQHTSILGIVSYRLHSPIVPHDSHVAALLWSINTRLQF